MKAVIAFLFVVLSSVVNVGLKKNILTITILRKKSELCHSDSSQSRLKISSLIEMVGPEQFENALDNSYLMSPSLSGSFSFPLELCSLQPITLQTLRKAFNSPLACPETSLLKRALLAMGKHSATAFFQPHLALIYSRWADQSISDQKPTELLTLQNKTHFSCFVSPHPSHTSALCMQYCNGRWQNYL